MSRIPDIYVKCLLGSKGNGCQVSSRESMELSLCSEYTLHGLERNSTHSYANLDQAKKRQTQHLGLSASQIDQYRQEESGYSAILQVLQQARSTSFLEEAVRYALSLSACYWLILFTDIRTSSTLISIGRLPEPK